MVVGKDGWQISNYRNNEKFCSYFHQLLISIFRKYLSSQAMLIVWCHFLPFSLVDSMFLLIWLLKTAQHTTKSTTHNTHGLQWICGSITTVSFKKEDKPGTLSMWIFPQILLIFYGSVSREVFLWRCFDLDISMNIVTPFLQMEVWVKLSLKQSNLARTARLKFANKSTWMSDFPD